MALCTPSDLSLGKLGLITSNITPGSEVKLDEDCGEGDEGSEDSGTRMWRSFRIGSSVALNNVSKPSNSSDGRGQFWIKVKGDVGEYMGGTSSGEKVLSSLDVNINANSTPYVWNIQESNVGAYYSKILSNSSNSSDYEGGFDWLNNTYNTSWGITQNNSIKDQFTWTAV